MNHAAISKYSFIPLAEELFGLRIWDKLPLGPARRRNTWALNIALPEDLFSQTELRQCLPFFWQELSPLEQKVFLRRYEYLDSTAEIAERFGFSQRRVKAMLQRMSRTLRTSMAAAGLA